MLILWYVLKLLWRVLSYYHGALNARLIQDGPLYFCGQPISGSNIIRCTPRRAVAAGSDSRGLIALKSTLQDILSTYNPI